jgi:hypothetical protein
MNFTFFMHSLGQTDFWGPILIHRFWLGLLPSFATKCLSRAVAKCESAEWDLFMVHPRWYSTTSPGTPGILEQRISRTTESSRWTNGVTCSFRWITSLIFLSLGKIWNLMFVLNKSVTSKACSNECKMDLRWFVGLLKFSSESAITVQTCNVLPWSLRWTPWAFPLIFKRPKLGY